MFSTVIPKETNFGALSVAVWRQTGRLAAVWVAVLGLASCAVSPIGDGISGAATPEAEREAVAKRVNARWDALVKGDVDASYTYLSPASRQSMTLEQYKRVTRKRGFRGAKIESIACDAGVCSVKLTITYDHKLMKAIETPVEEKWVFDKGQAWFVYRG